MQSYHIEHMHPNTMANSSPIWTTQQNANNAPARIPTAESGKTCFNNPFLVAVQSKFRRKYYHKAVFVILVMIIIILIIALIILACQIKNTNNICDSKECLQAASNLLQSMDQTVDPCEDFYQFTCGNWAEEHPRPDSVTSHDWFSEKQSKVMRKIRSFLQENETLSEPQAVSKAKTMYRGCMNTNEMDELGLTPLLSYMKKWKLPTIPSFFNITSNSTKANETLDFDWVESLALIKQSLGMDIMIGFDVFPDPTNRTVNRIAIGTPESGSTLPFNDDDHHTRLKKAKEKYLLSEDSEDEEAEDDDKKTTALTAYVSYIRKVVAVILLTVEPELELENLVEGINEAAIESIRITKYLYKLNEDAENLTKANQNPLEDLINVNIYELQNMTDEVISPKSIPIWEKYLKIMLSTTNNVKFDLKTGLILTSKSDVQYLQQVSEFLTDTPKSHIEFFIWWTTVEELILHTTSEIRRLHSEYTRSVINTEGSTSRSLYCASGVNSMMGMAVSYTLADEKFLTDTKPKVERMLMNIREAFNGLVKATSWMDDKTKQQTLEKSASMKSFIGFPEWIMNKTFLDAFYQEIDVNATTHLNNLIDILRWQMRVKLRSLSHDNEFGWATAPSNVNAFHTFQANTITVPIAILQYPFYELGLEALNYGAIGTILGHELTHGFDDSGRMFDKSGNMRQWWSNRTITEYVNRTQCFIKQYSGFYLSDIGEYVNGELTLGENIADNGGLREAYYAYKILVKSVGAEKLLPGLEKYNHEQLLFISFGNLWCETFTPAASRYALEDSHCPGRIRLLGVLRNSPEFSKTFKCREGSGMFPSTDRCRIW